MEESAKPQMMSIPSPSTFSNVHLTNTITLDAICCGAQQHTVETDGIFQTSQLWQVKSRNNCMGRLAHLVQLNTSWDKSYCSRNNFAFFIIIVQQDFSFNFEHIYAFSLKSYLGMHIMTANTSYQNWERASGWHVARAHAAVSMRQTLPQHPLCEGSRTRTLHATDKTFQVLLSERRVMHKPAGQAWGFHAAIQSFKSSRTVVSKCSSGSFETRGKGIETSLEYRSSKIVLSNPPQSPLLLL